MIGGVDDEPAELPELTLQQRRDLLSFALALLEDDGGRAAMLLIGAEDNGNIAIAAGRYLASQLDADSREQLIEHAKRDLIDLAGED
jgi:hypothetical protein